ncbi:hypothetical protein [Massilia soli]|uniref:Uncharacterized protein n=1 Tax=Massilia soli TaxID=2792854 RepID=A0ABS7SMB5_9BURK|nr:hypothetical protein [Massilia soli]MBZ2207192.1 hypothetical protein [Massilia soli]
MKTLRTVIFMGAFLSAPIAKADFADKLSRLVGYAIVDAKTIKAWYDDGDGEKGEGAFKGCKHGRVIVFADDKVLTCAQYGYQYAYRPTAVIIAKPITLQGRTHYDYKMVVDDEIYDMRR